MLTADEARNIALKHTRVQTMLRDVERIVEACIRSSAENGKLEAAIDLSVLPSVSADDEIKDRVVDAMLAELKMMGYHLRPVEGSRMYRINWREGEEE